MTPRLLFRSDDRSAPIEIKRRHLAFWIVCAVLVLAAYGFVAAYLGSQWTIETARAEAAKIVTHRATPAINPPLPLIGCSTHDLIEHVRTCKARTRAGAVQ